MFKIRRTDTMLDGATGRLLRGEAVFASRYSSREEAHRSLCRLARYWLDQDYEMVDWDAGRVTLAPTPASIYWPGPTRHYEILEASA